MPVMLTSIRKSIAMSNKNKQIDSNFEKTHEDRKTRCHELYKIMQSNKKEAL